MPAPTTTWNSGIAADMWDLMLEGKTGRPCRACGEPLYYLRPSALAWVHRHGTPQTAACFPAYLSGGYITETESIRYPER